MCSKKIVYVGIDVEECSISLGGIIGKIGEFFDFKCMPDHGVLHKKLTIFFADR